MALDKVIDSAVLDAGLTSVADAIRAKGGTSEQMDFPGGFVSAVEGIQAGGGTVERTAWYRPPDMPDYDSLNLPDDEAYVFFTYDTEIPIDASLKRATFGWCFYNTAGRGYNIVNVDRGHIANGKFIIDERILENQYFSFQKSVDIELPTNAGRFVVYRISSANPTADVNDVLSRLYDFTDEYGNTIQYKMSPCVETFMWNVGSKAYNIGANQLTTNHTYLYTVKGCRVAGGTGEFWNNETQAPYVAIYDRVRHAPNFGYLPFTGLRGKCKALYLTNSELQMMRSDAQNQFQNASGLEVLDFSGSTIIATGMNNCFSGCTSLRRLDLSGWVMTGVTTMNNVFYNMTSLVELTLPEMPALSFSLDKSVLLTVASLNQIISVLPQLGEGVSCTLTLGATNTAKLTEAEIAVATGKGWTVA